jgi:phosphate transport system protein
VAVTLPERNGPPPHPAAIPAAAGGSVPGQLRHTFAHQLAELQDDVLRLGSVVSEMVALAMQALLRQDLNLAERVISMDDTADELDFQIEQKCMRLLALQHPMARDLRIVGTGLKVITDLERIGDYAVDMAKTARRLAREPILLPLHDLQRMSQEAEWMVREAIHSYVEHDLDLVTQVIARDDVVDAHYDQLFSQLLPAMERDPHLVRQATWVLHVGRFLERIADHAVNVAERVHYVETGEREAGVMRRREERARRPTAPGDPPQGA